MAYDDPYKSPEQPTSGPGGMPPADKPKNWLVESIISTVCCCPILGVVSIVFAAQVDTKWNSGDHAGAHESAKKAKTFFWLAIGLGILANVLYIGAMIATGEFDNF